MDLSQAGLDVLRVLRRSVESLSGRQVSEIVGVSPHTANKLLKALEAQGLAASSRVGRAVRWTTTADVALVAELSEGDTQERVALVVTAVPLEATEVRKTLVNAERVRVAGWRFIRGEIPGDGIRWTVFLAQVGMGNATSAALTGLAAGELNANVVAFVGSAGGLKPADHRHGDVVVASRIHNPYAGKQVVSATGSELLGRDRTYHVPAPLLNLAYACIADSEWTPSAQDPQYNIRHSHAFVAPIVAVEAVQTDPGAELVEEIRQRFQDTAALDMESYGLAAGSDVHDLPVLVVRGISDFLTDKVSPGNDDHQPAAVANAATFLRHMLASAHPDDFRRVAGGLTPDRPGSGKSPTSETPEVVLPGGVKIWFDRLRRRSPSRSESAIGAIQEMRESGMTAATWLNKAIHRPPAWLREDDTGDGWALVGNLASLAESKVSWRAFDAASAAAGLTGARSAQGFFKVMAAVNKQREPGDQEGLDAALAALDNVPRDLYPAIAPMLEFYRAAIAREPLPQIKAAGETAISWLGLADESGFLQHRDVGGPHHDFDDELRDYAAAGLLQHMARMMLTPGAADDFGVRAALGSRGNRGNPVLRDLSDDALRLAQWALRLRPMSESARLVEAQTLLAVIVSMTGRGRGDVDLEISKRAKQVELQALEVRDAYREWHAPSGAALAAAARARSMQGDYGGALRMLTPAPDGIATVAEARDSNVVRLAAFFSLATGQRHRALELAAKCTDPLEAALMKASVYRATPKMAREANEALFEALDLADDKDTLKFQALMGLVARHNQLSTEEKVRVESHIAKIAEVDPDLADVLRARSALSEGHASEALELVRGLPSSELALTAHADALIGLGQADKAVEMLFEEGIARRDVQLVLSALDLADEHGYRDSSRKIASTLLAGESSDVARIRAVQALRRVERLESNWPMVLNLTERLMNELTASGLPVPESEHWTLVEALYFEERFDRALDVLMAAPSLSFNEREKVLLFFSVLKRAFDERRATGRLDRRFDDALFRMFMEAAREWAEDEQLAAFALTLTMTAPDAQLTESQVVEIREYADRYFATFGDQGALIRQISVEDDNFDALIEYLSNNAERTQQLEDLTRMVRVNLAPLSILTSAAGRTYAESLIRVDLGYLIAVDADGGAGLLAAREAMNHRVVVDTSALVVGPLTGVAMRTLLGKFDSVHFPEVLRSDVERARGSLALRSTGSLGWDARRKQPTVSEISAEEAEGFATAANDLWALAQSLRIERQPDSSRRDGWLSAVRLAQELGLALWADDAALRQLARGEGVPAFGSLDLIAAYATEEDVAEVLRTLRDSRVVDLPITEPWHSLARDAGWDASSPFAAAIARPFAWRDAGEAFNQFKSLIHLREPSMQPGVIAAWTHVAANGLALAMPADAKQNAVASLLAWTMLQTDPFFSSEYLARRSLGSAEIPDNAGEVSQYLFRVAEELRLLHFPHGDTVGLMVALVGDILGPALGPAAASAVVADFAELLGEPFGPRVFAAFLRAASP